MPSTTPQLSIIVPTLNEAKILPALLAQLGEQQQVDMEIIIADGGSNDDCVALAQKAADERNLKLNVVHSTPGRAYQMNAGAATAHANLLLFLHADTGIDDPLLLHNALNHYQHYSQQHNDRRVAGHFPLRFKRSNEDHALAYYFYEAKTHLNRIDCINGDQGFLIGKAFFDTLYGFDQRHPYMEDARLARRIFTTGKWITLPGHVTTSARRFETEGLKARQTLNSFLCNFDAIGMDSFFDQAVKAYRAQDRTTTLKLRPFLRIIHQLMWEKDFFQSLGRWHRSGCYIAGNAWQLAFALDCKENFKQGKPPGTGPTPRLKFFDLHLARVFKNTWIGAITAALTMVWFYALTIKAELSHERH